MFLQYTVYGKKTFSSSITKKMEVYESFDTEHNGEELARYVT